MPVALPSRDHVNLSPPERDEVEFILGGLLSACVTEDGNTRLQVLVLSALARAMTGFDVDPTTVDRPSAREFAEGLARRNDAFRTRMVQMMELGHMILPEPSVEVADRIIDFAGEMSIANDCIHKARAVADGSHALVAADFDRSSYISGIDSEAIARLDGATSDPVTAWTERRIDDQLAARWNALGDCPDGSLGQHVHRFYTARGFMFPGQDGSVPPLLAQHDWVHVLAGFGSAVESELEVFAFIARANDDPQSFTLLAMAINLFQSGSLPSAAGSFEASAGHLERCGMPVRLADAMRRGAQCEGSTDFLTVDYFALADQPVDDVREQFGIGPKSDEAIRCGSVTPWDVGGMTVTQLGWGRDLASARGSAYESFGATPPPD